ncbi:hypothetical protein BGZ74_000089 [Mortierella antarctica]|nr:hypothetical protein BGZ74_000089 [Mortierella antarctica]
MAIGTLIAVSLAPSSIAHLNGDHIQIQRFLSWTGELVAMMKFFLNSSMVVLIPMFLTSNWFYSYQFLTMNRYYFLPCCWSFALILNYQGVNCKTRSLWGLMIIACFVATWVRGALSNDVTVLLCYAGFYKCIQSCGAAFAWRINAVSMPFMELIICFAFLVASIPRALFLSMHIKDHSDEEEEDV